ncbi:hypothetical protein KZZ05_08615 [Marinobacter adhaerens]|uniref:hypothetical protein n=1 Tax=Marinobacter adhaerens TaxID=1033846 RepID=UPI000C997976|nr:hypothetical protein [Marinobacter adhaerens]MAI33484.1 hypothetical protein [Rhodopirellula sp.]MBW4978335.1 hypothetical protein [Marinobacter adhaerens]HCA36845.1 hypothetical protein [Gammaproteobacteria bacterium]
MPDSIREQVVQAFADRLNAKRGEQLDSEQDLPARVIWDPSETAEKLKYRKYEMTLTLNVGEMAKVDTTINSSVQGNQMLAGLLNDALASDQTLGGLCKHISYTDSVLDSPDPGQNEMIILVTFQIVYETSNTSPYQ